MPKQKEETIELTYGQVAQASRLFYFLRWLSDEKVTLPENDEERSEIIVKYVKYDEHQQFTALMARLKAEKKGGARRGKA